MFMHSIYGIINHFNMFFVLRYKIKMWWDRNKPDTDNYFSYLMLLCFKATCVVLNSVLLARYSGY